MFAVKKATCLGCKMSIGPKQHQSYLRKLHSTREAEIYLVNSWNGPFRYHVYDRQEMVVPVCRIVTKKVQADIRLARCGGRWWQRATA